MPGNGSGPSARPRSGSRREGRATEPVRARASAVPASRPRSSPRRARGPIDEHGRLRSTDRPHRAMRTASVTCPIVRIADAMSGTVGVDRRARAGSTVRRVPTTRRREGSRRASSLATHTSGIWRGSAVVVEVRRSWPPSGAVRSPDRPRREVTRPDDVGRPSLGDARSFRRGEPGVRVRPRAEPARQGGHEAVERVEVARRDRLLLQVSKPVHVRGVGELGHERRPPSVPTHRHEVTALADRPSNERGGVAPGG